MPSARKAVMQMNEKQRKAAIIVASILGCGALFYLGGLLGQVFTNYTIWMESGGMWGQTQIAAPDWNPAVCLLNAFSWNGVKAIFLIVVIGATVSFSFPTTPTIRATPSAPPWMPWRVSGTSCPRARTSPAPAPQATENPS